MRSAKPKPKPRKAPGGLPDEDPVRDLKKFIDTYNKACEKHSGIMCAGIIKKIRQEIAVWNEGEREQLPNFPILVNEAMDYNGVKALCETLADYRWLHQLSFWRSKIGDDGVMVVAEFLRKDTRLKTLELMNANVTVRGCGYLGRVMTVNETLTNLILDYNEVGDEGVVALGDGLKWNSSVAFLSMQYCSIGALGGEAVARFILRSSSVKELYLKGNRIGPQGVIAISQALAKNMTITKLDLSDNSFGIDLEALEALRDGIESNESLTWLDLHLNSMVPAGAAMLAEVLHSKPNVTEFRMYERVGDETYTDVLDTVTANQKALKKSTRKKKSKKKT